MVWVILEYISLINSAILITVGIVHNAWLFCRHNHRMFVQKRSRMLLYGLNLSFILGAIPIFTFTQIAVINYMHSHLVLSITFTAFFVIWWILLFFLITKNWLIWYRYHWTFYTIETDWQQLINSNYASDQNEHNWFITNHAKYGNLCYIKKLFGIFCFIAMIICSISAEVMVNTDWAVIPTAIGMVFIALSLSAAIILYAYVVRKTPAYDDTFFVHHESKVHSKILMVMCVIYSGLNFGFLFSGSFNVVIICLPLMNIGCFAMNYASTVMIIKKNKRHIECRVSKILSVRLDMVLSHETPLHLFMVYLSKELSMECLLSYIEMVQYQNYLRSFIKSEEPLKSKTIVHFPSNIPTSSIIESNPESTVIDTNNGSNQKELYFPKLYAHKIYNKYIKFNSEFEINISYDVRQPVKDVLDDYDLLSALNITVLDLFKVFDPAISEMHILLTYSLSRFRKESEFAQVVSSLKGDH